MFVVFYCKRRDNEVLTGLVDEWYGKDLEMSYMLNFEHRNSYLYITVTGENSSENVLRYL